jgi:SpoVK/Ycf46/Vps4 family AAA+-type ATPase
MSLKDTARKIPGVAAVEDAVTGALAEERDLPIARYDTHSAADIASKLKGFSQRELRLVDAYERRNQSRSTITDKIAKLTGDEPWSGYDEQSVDEISAALDAGDAQTAQEVKAYERGRKARVGVIESADKRIAR